MREGGGGGDVFCFVNWVWCASLLNEICCLRLKKQESVAVIFLVSVSG